MKVTTAVRQHGRPRKGCKEIPVTIRVTFKKVPIYFGFDLSLLPDDFRKWTSPKLGERMTEIAARIEEKHEQVKEIIKRLNPFSFEDFRREYYATSPAVLAGEDQSTTPKITPIISETPEPEGFTFSGHTRRYGKRRFERVRSLVDYKALGPLAEVFGSYIKELEAEEKIGTSESYFSSMTSLLAYKPALRIEDVTKPFLLGYQKWMTDKGNSLTTVGMYLRNVRALYNLQIEDGMISRDLYPFGKGRRQYQIPTGRNIKKFLELPEIKLLYDYQTKTTDPNELLGRDMWFFLFFGNGMNPKDVAMLKHRDIDGDYIRFLREKTKNTTVSNPQLITVPLNDDLRTYIERWGNQDKHPDNFVFPVLKRGLSAHRQKELVQLFVKIINNTIGMIARESGITKPVRCMWARHSYVTIMLRAGASLEYIRQALGHMSSKTTQAYVGSFEDAAKTELSGKLVAFKNLTTIPAAQEAKAV